MMKNALFNLGAGSLLALLLTLSGCDKKAAPSTVAEATPSPTPAKPDDLFTDKDIKDLDFDKLRAKAGKAADDLGKYLETQDPKLRDRFDKLSHRIQDQLAKDKGRWREKLQAKRKELEPQIARLRDELARNGDATKDKLRDQLSELEKQSDTTDQKLSKLESIGADAWKHFKEQLKVDNQRDRARRQDLDSPTPTPQG